MDVPRPTRRVGSGLRDTLGLLRDRNCGWWFGGRLLHNIGMRIWWAAELWLIVTVTGNGVAVGVTVAVQYLPTVLLAPWAGVWADRPHQRRPRLVRAELAMVAAAAALWALTLTRTVEVWMVLALVAARGFAATVFRSSGRIFQIEVTGEGAIERGVALEGLAWQIPAVVGPALAGAVMDSAGVTAALVLVVLCTAGVIPTLTAIDTTRLHVAPTRAPSDRDGRLRVAVRAVRALPALWIPLVALGIIATFADNLDVLMPLLASETWHGDAGTYGLMTTTLSVGLVIGAVVAAARARASLSLIVASSVAWGAGSVLAAAAPTFALQLAALLLVGVAVGVTTFALQASLLRAASGPLRGRVAALYDLVGAGITPAGDPLVGGVAEAGGPRIGLLFQATAAFVAAGAVAVSRWRWERSRRTQGELS